MAYFVKPEVKTKPYTKDIPVAQLNSRNREELESVLKWHEERVDSCETRSVDRHKQIIRDLRGELNL